MKICANPDSSSKPPTFPPKISFIALTRSYAVFQQSKNVKNLVEMSSLEPSTFRIRSYDEYQTSAAQSYYRFHSRNLVWQADGGSVTSQTMSGSAQSSLSCSALPWDTACASNADGESSANHVTSHATNRKRQGEEGVKKDAENSGEPLMKRQRSHENCQNAAAPESAACPPEKPNAENAVGAAPEAATSTPKQSEKFAVPDDWE